MRLGAYIGEFHSPEEWAHIHLQHGYGAVYWPFDTVPYTSDSETIQGYVDSAARHGLVIAEVGAWCNMLDPKPSVRDANLNYIIGQLRLADQVGARCCVNIAGSLNPALWDGPHPDNLTEATFGLTVELIQQIIDSAKPRNTFYTIEQMPWLFPYDIPSTHRLLKAVNRSALAVHVDMCNMINAPDKVYRTGELTREFFSEFGPLIRSVHVKDLTITDELTVCIREVIPGQGVFDLETLLNECAKLDSDLPVMAEHLETQAQYLQSTGFLKKKAAEMGLGFVTGH